MNSRLTNFLTFQYLVTPRIIQWVWLVGVAMIVYFSIVMMTFRVTLPWYISLVAGSTQQAVHSTAVLSGLIFLILGNLTWRVLCETLYATCSIHSQLLENTKTENS